MRFDIQTARLDLELLEPEHADSLFNGLRDECLYEFIDDDPPESADILRSRYARLAGRKSPDGTEIWLNWAVLKRHNASYIGYVQATVNEDCSAQIAYMLFRDVWGHGYAREAAGAMVRHIHDRYNVSTFRASVDPRNHRSIALLLALGFSKSKSRRASALVHGVHCDEVEYILDDPG